MALTRGYLTQHFQGKAGGFYPALLDVAQDYLLHHLHRQNLFDLGLIFKGGTSLRKMRAGVSGRFSTDLDFCAPNEDLAGLVMDAIDNVNVPPFTYVLSDRDDDAGRATLRVTGPFGPGPAETGPTAILIASKVEFSPRAPWLAPQTLPFLPLRVHRSYDLDGGLPALPVVRTEEAVAEKLARYARVGLARDLYDLIWYGRQGAFDEAFIRRLWLLKVYQDVVFDGRWSGRRFDPATILTPRSPREIAEESIGFLTYPTDIPGWEREFRQRYCFLADLSREDAECALCHAGRRYEFTQTAQALGAAL